MRTAPPLAALAVPIALIVPLFFLGTAALAQPSTSVWDGVYTDAQAATGSQEFGQHCAECHGGGLQGNGEAPALTGGEFLDDFDGLTVGDLFDRISRTMPQNAPGTLSPQTYANVLAFILKANGFPAGKTPLSDRSAFLHAIAFQAINPHPGKDPPAAPTTGRATTGAAAGFMLASAATSVADPPSAPPAQQGARARRARRGGYGGFRSPPPPSLAALAAADKASGVLSPTASDPRNAPNSQPDPYTANTEFLKMPPGRKLGSTSAVAVDSHGNVWVADRCGRNSCANSQLAPIMEFDANGNYIKAFGAGMMIFPHGFYIDSHDHIWITDEMSRNGKGADVLEFNEDGKLLRTLGKPGVSLIGRQTFSKPTAVVVAPNGDIFVADGHDPGPPNAARVVKFSPQGKFLMQWGSRGIAAGQFNVPHCLAIDQEGRIYVGDRWNNRIQVFTEDGKLLSILTQFGRPSGCYVDKNDILYVTDSESRAPFGYGYHPGWKRGIRVGSVKDGIVTAFIPDTTVDPDKYSTSGGEGIWAANGAIYSAQVKQMNVVKYVRQ